MIISGRGMIAQSLINLEPKFEDVVVFAQGVSDSACIDQKMYDRECVLLNQMLIQCKKTKKHFVYFSSGGAVYGETNDIRDENSPLNPVNKYGRHKLLCESIIKNFGVRYYILRLPNVVGSTHSIKQLIPFLITKAICGNVTLQKDAGRDLIAVSDVAKILNLLLSTVQESIVINVASGQCISIVNIFSQIQESIRTNAKIDLVAGGNKQNFSIKKMEALIPSVMNFEENYYKSVIGKYACQIAMMHHR